MVLPGGLEHIPQVIRRLADLKPDPENPRRHPPEQIAALAGLMREVGWTMPILIDEHDVIIAGHGRLEGGLAAGYTEGPTKCLAGLTPMQRRAVAIADNAIPLGAAWDEERLAAQLGELHAAEFDMRLLGFSAEELAAMLPGADGGAGGSGSGAGGAGDGDERYTSKINAPVYTPTSDKAPEIAALTNRTRADRLLAEIEAADLPPDVREFLRAATARHVVFNYKAIAEFYCHAAPEVQRLMEASALVIIDSGDAIIGGYVQLAENLIEIYKRTGAGQPPPEVSMMGSRFRRIHHAVAWSRAVPRILPERYRKPRPELEG